MQHTKLLRKGDKTFYYEDRHQRDNKMSLRKMGYFFMRDGKFYFQFAGTSFQMSGSKKYEATLKLIDMTSKTWIAVNSDRKGIRKSVGEYIWLDVINQAYQMELMDLIAE